MFIKKSFGLLLIIVQPESKRLMLTRMQTMLDALNLSFTELLQNTILYMSCCSEGRNVHRKNNLISLLIFLIL